MGKQKTNLKATIKNAFVTFKCYEGQEACLNAFQIFWLEKFLAETCKCATKNLKKKYFLQTTLFRMERAVEPNKIMWENIGAPMSSNIMRALSTIYLSIVVLVINFFILWNIQNFERARSDWVTGTCNPKRDYTIDDAFYDHFLEK